MNKGTIILVRFPFTDFSSEKRRPAVIISSNNENRNDVIVAFISSVVPTKLLSTDILITQSDPLFSETHLHKTSIIRLDKVMTIDKELITGEIGIIPFELKKQLDDKLKIVFGL